MSEFGRALALNPRDAANYNNRGAALAALGQTAAARQDFERALPWTLRCSAPGEPHCTDWRGDLDVRVYGLPVRHFVDLELRG